MNKKYCPLCKQEKELSEFGKNRAKYDGLATYCKMCKRKKSAQWRSDNIEHARELDRRQKERERERKGKEAVREEQRLWYKNNSKKKRAKVAEYRAKNKKKVWAQNKLHKAVDTGKIIRPSTCSNCNRHKDNIDGHHHDYNKPYDVVWLCRSCHSKIHTKTG